MLKIKIEADGVTAKALENNAKFMEKYSEIANEFKTENFSGKKGHNSFELHLSDVVVADLVDTAITTYNSMSSVAKLLFGKSVNLDKKYMAELKTIIPQTNTRKSRKFNIREI